MTSLIMFFKNTLSVELESFRGCCRYTAIIHEPFDNSFWFWYVDPGQVWVFRRPECFPRLKSELTGAFCYAFSSMHLLLMCLSQGFKLTKQSMWRSTPNWLAVSAKRHPAAGYMSNQQSLGLQLAQLGRDASAAVCASKFSLKQIARLFI